MGPCYALHGYLRTIGIFKLTANNQNWHMLTLTYTHAIVLFSLENALFHLLQHFLLFLIYATIAKQFNGTKADQEQSVKTVSRVGASEEK